MSKFALDASAVLWVLRRELGADDVVEHGRGSVNVAEVLSHPDIRQASRERLEAGFRAMHLREISFDREQAEPIALIYLLSLGSSIGFADRPCMALARKCAITALTADHDWLQHDAVVDVQLFRQRSAL